MNTIRIVVILFCGLLGWTLGQTELFIGASLPLLISGLIAGAVFVGIEMAFLGKTKPRQVTAIALGFVIGSAIAHLIGESPLMGAMEGNSLLLTQLALFVFFSYLGCIVFLRGNDGLVACIPFMRFVSAKGQGIGAIIIDSSALIDGRIVAICQSRFISGKILVPRFILEDLHKMAENDEDGQKQAKGKKGIEILNKLKNMPYVDIRIQDIEFDTTGEIGSKLLYMATLYKAKLLTLDFNLIKLAEHQGLECLNLNALAKALNPEIAVGQYFDIELVKNGKEDHQGVGYLPDGSMVVVNEAASFIGKGKITAEVISKLPSAGGQMIFARLHEKGIDSESMKPAFFS